MLSNKPEGIMINPFIAGLLEQLIVKTDKGQKTPKIIVGEKTVPALYDFKVHNPDDLCQDLLVFAKQAPVIVVSPKAKYRYSDTVYEKAKITLAEGQESVVREWINRPKKVSYGEQWLNAVNNSVLRENCYIQHQPLNSKKHSAQEIVWDCFVLKSV